MDERKARVIRELAEQRQRLGDDISALELQFSRVVDWRTYFISSTWLVLGLAAGAGYLLSAMFSRRSR